MPDYRIGRLNGEFVLVFYKDKRRVRYRLGTDDPREAERRAPRVYAELTRPQSADVKTLWDAYCQDKAGRAVTFTMVHTWKALRGRFAATPGAAITVADCRAHTEARRLAGISDGTIHTELGHLRMVLLWAVKHGLLDRAPYIERPSKPKPKEAHLTREQARALRDACIHPHVRLFVVIAQTTAARVAAILGLTWDRCDFERGLIDLRDPTITRPHKGRAITPMNRDCRAALLEAQRGAQTDYVIEWAGRRVQFIKRGLHEAGRRAGLGTVSPHMLRHSAAVHMAEAGIPFEEIAQYLGHANVNVTRNVYARFSPTYLQGAASVLEYDDLADTKRKLK